jgi:hypothetical protein
MQFKGNGECETFIGWRSKRLWRCQLFRWGKGDSVTETGPPANNAMPNRGYRRWGSGTAVHKGQILRCAFLRGMACVSEAPHGNRHWADPFAATGWLLLCENCPHGPKLRTGCKSSALLQVLPALLFAADLSHVILQDLPHQWVSACMQVQGSKDGHIPHPHSRLLSLPPSSTYIIAIFHLPHPGAAAVFAKTFVIRIWGPIQAAACSP